MPVSEKVKRATIALKNQDEPEVMFQKMDKELKKYVDKWEFVEVYYTDMLENSNLNRY